MRKAAETVELEALELQSPLHPTRSGRSLKHRQATPIERRQERKEAAEIAALKVRVEQHGAIQSQWNVAREELAAQKLARAADAARVAEQIVLLESAMAVATLEAARTVETVSKQRNLWRTLAAIAATVALTALGVALWRPLVAPRPVVGYPTQSPVRAKARAARNPLPRDPQAALTTALGRLNGALENVPERTPEQILKKITSESDRCAIIWTNGLPSIVFGVERGPSSIAMTLEQCAEAVDDLR